MCSNCTRQATIEVQQRSNVTYRSLVVFGDRPCSRVTALQPMERSVTVARIRLVAITRFRSALAFQAPASAFLETTKPTVKSAIQSAIPVQSSTVGSLQCKVQACFENSTVNGVLEQSSVRTESTRVGIGKNESCYWMGKYMRSYRTARSLAKVGESARGCARETMKPSEVYGWPRGCSSDRTCCEVIEIIESNGHPYERPPRILKLIRLERVRVCTSELFQPNSSH